MNGLVESLIGLSGASVLILCASVGDEWIRRTQMTDLAIVGLPLDGVLISGSQQPDFLWAGRAWWIEIQTDKPLVLTLDSWSGLIPAGRHTLFSNHNHTNTGQYGDRDFWGFPESVSVEVNPGTKQ